MDINRKTALDILILYERNKVYPNLTLKKSLRNINNDRDKRFICALVYGVIEKKILLDYYISNVSSVKLNKINVVVLSILRMGLYQLIFLSTPSSAACNTSVELAKTNGQFKSSGFINAVLRKLSQLYDKIPLPTDKTNLLSVKYSVSPQVLDVLTNSLGEKNAEKYISCDFPNSKNIYISVNTLKTTDSELCEQLDAENIAVSVTEFDGLLKICGGFDIESSRAYRSGLFHVISKPSFIAAKLVGAKTGDIVYDMCAAPGGKTFAIGYMSNGNADITAFDIHKHKCDNMLNECKRLGLNNIRSISSDSTVLHKELISTADCVLCDVPCSGLGMLHKKPDIKYKNIDYQSLASIQRKILQNGAEYLKSNGRLIYSTCTVNKYENSEVICDFLKNNPQFEIDKSVDIYNNEHGEKLFLPYLDNTDGFYIAVLRKK